MPTETNSLVVLGPLWPVQGAGLVAPFKHLVLMSDEISVKTLLSTRYTVHNRLTSNATYDSQSTVYRHIRSWRIHHVLLCCFTMFTENQ